MKGSERLQAAFPEGRVALVPYLTAGYPTLDGADEGGAGHIEGGAGRGGGRGSLLGALVGGAYPYKTRTPRLG